VISTASFAAGKSLANVITKALKACGNVPPPAQSGAQPGVPTPQLAAPEPTNGGTETLEAMPAAEKAVIDAVEQARQDYASASNDMQKGASRPTRAKSTAQPSPTGESPSGLVTFLRFHQTARGRVY
jgi:hypothetical protein